MPLNRSKYMDTAEVCRLREIVEAWSASDFQAGRQQGVTAWAVVDLALLTGLRVSEISSLDVGDVDLRRAFLSVETAKRRRPQRDEVALPPELVHHLRHYLKWRQDLGRGPGPESPMFVGKRGRLTASGLQKLWKSAIKRAGLPRELSIHSARHTVGVHLLAKTGDMRLVQKQLRHARLDTTAIYADVTFERMQAGVHKLYGSR